MTRGPGAMTGMGMEAGSGGGLMMVWQQGTGPVSGPKDAASRALAAVRARGWDWLAVDEVHVFPVFDEVEFNDRDGYKGPEVYVNDQTGAAGPEMGPNLMWDNRYGMGTACPSELDAVTARRTAQAYRNRSFGGEVSLGDSERHHGYWEFELKKASSAINQINVNGCRGTVVDERMWQPNMVSTYAPNG